MRYGQSGFNERNYSNAGWCTMLDLYLPTILIYSPAVSRVSIIRVCLLAKIALGLNIDSCTSVCVCFWHVVFASKIFKYYTPTVTPLPSVIKSGKACPTFRSRAFFSD